MPPKHKTATVPSKRRRTDDDGGAAAAPRAMNNDDRRLPAWQERCARLENLVKELRPGLKVEEIVGPCPGMTGRFDYDMWTRHLRALDIPPLPAFRTLEDVANAPPRAPYGDFRTLGMFPHIVDEIVSYLTPTGLLALRGASRGLCEYVDARLAQHLVLEVRDSRVTTMHHGYRAQRQCVRLQPIGCFNPSAPRPKPTFSKGDIHQFPALPPPYQPRFSKVRLEHFGSVLNVRDRGRSTVAEIDDAAVPYLERARIVDVVQNSKVTKEAPLDFLLNPLTSRLSKVDILRIRRGVGFARCPITPKTLIYFTYHTHSSWCDDLIVPDGTEKVVLVYALDHMHLLGSDFQGIAMARSVKELVIILHEVHSTTAPLLPSMGYFHDAWEPFDAIVDHVLSDTAHVKLTVVGPDPANPKGMDCVAGFLRKIPEAFVKRVARHYGLPHPNNPASSDIHQAAREYINNCRIMTFDAYRAEVGDKQFDLEMMAEDWMPHDRVGSCPGCPREESE